MTVCKTLAPDALVCGDPAPRTVTAGCVHEHLDQADPICDRHWKAMQDGKLRCPTCWRCPNPHWCPMVGRETS